MAELFGFAHLFLEESWNAASKVLSLVFQEAFSEDTGGTEIARGLDGFETALVREQKGIHQYKPEWDLDNFHRWGLRNLRTPNLPAREDSWWVRMGKWSQSYFGSYLPGTLLAEFLENFKTSDLWTWNISLDRCRSKFILKKMVVHYLDNDAARSAFIRANASTPLGTTLVADYIEFEYKCCFSPWFARVCKPQQPVRPAIKVDFTAAWLNGAYRVDVVCQRTCQNGESTGALTNENKAQFVRLTTTIGSKNQICTLFEFQLEAWPACRNFPDCANAEREKRALCYHSAIVCVSHVEHFIFWRGFDQNDGATAHFIPLEAKPHKRSLSKKQSV